MCPLSTKIIEILSLPIYGLPSFPRVSVKFYGWELHCTKALKRNSSVLLPMPLYVADAVGAPSITVWSGSSQVKTEYIVSTILGSTSLCHQLSFYFFVFNFWNTKSRKAFFLSAFLLVHLLSEAMNAEWTPSQMENMVMGIKRNPGGTSKMHFRE